MWNVIGVEGTMSKGSPWSRESTTRMQYQRFVLKEPAKDMAREMRPHYVERGGGEGAQWPSMPLNPRLAHC